MMGDRRYYSDGPNYGNSRQYQRPVSILFDMAPSYDRDPEQGGDKTSEPYCTEGRFSKLFDLQSGGTSVNSRRSQSHSDNCNVKSDSKFNSPPIYEYIYKDRLLSRSDWNTNYFSPVFKEGRNESLGEQQYSHKRPFSDSFNDLEVSKECAKWWHGDQDNFEQNGQSTHVDNTFQQSHNHRYKPEFYNNSFQGFPNDRFKSEFYDNNTFQQSYNDRYKSTFYDYDTFQPSHNDFSEPQSSHVTRQINNYQLHNFRQSGYQLRDQPKGYERFSGKNSTGSHRNNGNLKFQRASNQGFKQHVQKPNNVEENNYDRKRTHAEGSNGDDKEGGSDEELEKYDKVNTFIPNEKLVKKYEFYPPSAEEMGQIFKGLVIQLFFKVDRCARENSSFVLVCESFRRCEQFSNLEVEDGYHEGNTFRKICTIRYHGIMMARGIGENNNLKEPRVLAGAELINKLAMTCYTLKAKEEYFSNGGFEKMQQKREIPGIFRFVTEGEAPDLEAACNFIENFFKEDSDVELFFLFPKPQMARVKGWAWRNGYNYRIISGYLGVCKRRSPQYWIDQILGTGSMENEKYIVIPPRGIGNNLYTDFDMKNMIPKLKGREINHCTLKDKYGPRGVGPVIHKTIPPWELLGRDKKTKRKQRKINTARKLVQYSQARGKNKRFKYQNKKNKKNT